MNAPNAWAMVQADFRDLAALRGAVDVQAEELKIARAVRTGQPSPLHVPFRFGYLPPGLVAEGGMPDRGGAGIFLGDGRPGFEEEGGFGSALTVWVYPATVPDVTFCQQVKKFTNQFTVDGRAGCFTPVDVNPGTGRTTGLYLNVSGGLVQILIDSKHVGIYSDDQLKRIATSLQVATIRNPRTWFDATTTMPR